MTRPSWRLFIFRLKIDVGKIHIALGDDVKSQNARPFGQLHFGPVRHDIPVVPLTPGNGILLILDWNNINGGNQRFAVSIQGDFSAPVRGV